MIRLEVCCCVGDFQRDTSRLTRLDADRTSELRKKGYQGRRLGPIQMTTDTAVRVTRMIVQDRGGLQLPMSTNVARQLLTACSARRPGPVRRPSRAQDQPAREHRNAVPLRQGRGWPTDYAKGMGLTYVGTRRFDVANTAARCTRAWSISSSKIQQRASTTSFNLCYWYRLVYAWHSSQRHGRQFTPQWHAAVYVVLGAYLFGQVPTQAAFGSRFPCMMLGLDGSRGAGGGNGAAPEG